MTTIVDDIYEERANRPLAHAYLHPAFPIVGERVIKAGRYEFATCTGDWHHRYRLLLGDFYPLRRVSGGSRCDCSP